MMQLLSQLIEHHIRTIFMEKLYRQYAPNASHRPHFFDK